jgi:hypothetical protein
MNQLQILARGIGAIMQQLPHSEEKLWSQGGPVPYRMSIVHQDFQKLMRDVRFDSENVAD